MTTTTKPTPTASVETFDGVAFTVWTDWHAEPALDRPRTSGISVLDYSLALRIAKAIDDGFWHRDVEVVRDVDGATYVAARSFSIGKYADEMLREVGR